MCYNMEERNPRNSSIASFIAVSRKNGIQFWRVCGHPSVFGYIPCIGEVKFSSLNQKHDRLVYINTTMQVRVFDISNFCVKGIEQCTPKGISFSSSLGIL